MHNLRLSFFLALHDWFYERTISICALLALAGMLTPILVLLGVRNGVVLLLREQLLKDPSVLVIHPVGGFERSFSQEELYELGKLPGARFIIGRTREIATDLTMVSFTGQSIPIHVEPSAEGEPVLAKQGLKAPKDGAVPELILTEKAAAKLKVKVGDTLLLPLGRTTTEGKRESCELKLVLQGLLPDKVSSRLLGFLPLSLLEDLQDYRDDLAVPRRGFSGRERLAKRTYPSFRLYAKDLEAVTTLSSALQERGISVRTKAREIAAISSLDRALERIIGILSLAVAAGFVAFSLSSAEGAVRRKLRLLGLLRLFGFSRASLALYPLVQTALTCLFGVALAILAYLGISLGVDQAFSAQSGGQAICRLGFLDLAKTLGWVFFLSSLGACLAAQRACLVDPAKVMREV
ncbi:MAG: hypothetical protein IJS50_04800 [Desulfovibrio sp.]|nr:hypothetical protein [Desulfovibrio sp.]